MIDHEPTPEIVDSWVERARNGDDSAFEKIHESFRTRIYALALQMTRSAADAEDVTQEAFLRVHQNLDSFQGRSQFFTWLYRIAINLCHDSRRKNRRQVTMGPDEIRVRLASSVDARGNHQREIELRSEYVALLSAFDQIKTDYQEAIVLTQLQGLSHAEAAVVLGVSEGTVSWRIFEGRKELRGILERSKRKPRVRSGRWQRVEENALLAYLRSDQRSA